jgi:hypothetical protein
MDLYWSIERGRLVAGLRSTVQIADLLFKRRDAAELRLYFAGDDGVISERPATTEIRFAIKRPGDFGGAPLVFTAGFVQQPDLSWLAAPNLNTEQLNDYFTPPNVASKNGIAEISWRADEDSGWNSSQTLAVTIENDVIQGDEGTPVNAEEPTSYLTAAQSNARFSRYDAEQALDSTQQARARSNIGAAAAAHTHTVADLPIATSEEALAGVSETTLMTPALVAEVIDADVPGIITQNFSVTRSANGTDLIDLPTLPVGTWAMQLIGSLEFVGGSNTADFTLSMVANAGASPFASGTTLRAVVSRASTTTSEGFSLTNLNTPTTASLEAFATGRDSTIMGHANLICTASAPMRLTFGMANRTGGGAVLRGTVMFHKIA